MKKILNFLILTVIILYPAKSNSAVGCTLTDPDRDIKRIFSESTGYKTQFITIKERGGIDLALKIEKDLGDRLDSVYETLDVPYAFYTVLKGKEAIGYVHGVNQKATYGGMQLILATDLKGKVLDFYYQKLSSPEAKKFQDKKFTGQFIGLVLGDFLRPKEGPENKIDQIKDPSEKNIDDFLYTLRGIKKNLILQNKFLLEGKNYNSENKEKKDE